MTERSMIEEFVGESREEMAGNVCIGACQLVYQSPKDLLTDERWRNMLLCPVCTRNLAET